jgi:hypothetical protein
MYATAAKAVQALTQADETRRQWEAITAPTRQMAQAAAQELRHRQPDQASAPRQPAEADKPVLSAAREQSPPGSPDSQAWDAVLERIARTSEQVATAQTRLDSLRATTTPSENPDIPDLGPAWASFASQPRDAIIQPARPAITSAREVLHRIGPRQREIFQEAENA